MTTEPALSAELLAGASAYTDTAVIVLSRFSGEGWDRSSIEYNGEYNPWETETSMPKISGGDLPGRRLLSHKGRIRHDRAR